MTKTRTSPILFSSLEAMESLKEEITALPKKIGYSNPASDSDIHLEYCVQHLLELARKIILHLELSSKHTLIVHINSLLETAEKLLETMSVIIKSILDYFADIDQSSDSQKDIRNSKSIIVDLNFMMICIRSVAENIDQELKRI